MRIGIICPYSFDEPGGVQAHILELSRVLIAAGHTVRVLGPSSPGTQVPDFVLKGGRSLPIRYNGSVARISIGPGVRRRVRNFILGGDFDLLHLHEPNSPSYSMAGLWTAKGPILATYHASSSGSLALKAFHPMLRPNLKKIRGGIAVSEVARRWQVEHLGSDPVVIPNGVDVGVYREAHRQHLAANAENPDEGPVEVVFLGRLGEPRKGLNILLRALRRVDRDIRVTVMGGGRHPAMEGVDFVGRVSEQEKLEILGRADIFVAPNTGGESFGIVLVEAMAAGCAVLASDLESFAAVCSSDSDTPAGLLFANGSDRDLAEKLLLLIDDPAARARLIRAGQDRAQHYDWSSVSREVLAVYAAVTDGTKVDAR